MTVCGYSEKKRKHIVKLFCTRYNNKSIIFQPMFISRLSVNTLSITLSLVAILCPYSTNRKYTVRKPAKSMWFLSQSYYLIRENMSGF